MNKRRAIDWKNDKYLEMVMDPETGELVHYCREKLTEHRAHGYAKKKKS